MRVLSDALRMTFEEKARQAGNRFDSETGKVVATPQIKVNLPRLSEVVHNLPAACDALQFSQSIALMLAENLSPYIGNGPYAKFFDVDATEDTSGSAPLITLCDLDRVVGDPVLLVLTVQAVILEILRLLKPSGDGAPQPPSLLIIEEVGVLATESPELVKFIRDAWKTMRKYGVTCVGLTNEVADYADKAGPQEIWNISPNKLILIQNPDVIADMKARILKGTNGLVPSLYHCDLLGSLHMSKGEFSEALWMSDTAQGTYVYIPTGFDYWCAASDPVELATLKELSSKIAHHDPQCQSPMFEAISLVAENFPLGVREGGDLRSLSDAEKSQLLLKLSKNRG